MTGPADILRAEEQGLLACVHCGFCLNACPTYRVLGHEADSPRGRLLLMRAVAEDRLAPDDPAFRLHIDQCLGCRACEPVCPSGVPYGFLLEHARGTIAAAAGVSPSTRLLIAGYTTPGLSAFVTAGSRLLRGSGLARLLVRILPRRFAATRFGLAMLAASAPWRRLRQQPPGPVADSPAAAGHAAPASEGGPGTGPATRVGMLTGCVQASLFARVNAATERVLRANGCEVIRVPAQVCCGALDAHAGRLERARELARRNIAAFEAAGVEVVVANAAGCGAVMKEYAELLRHDEAWHGRARAFVQRVRDASEFLVQRGVARGGAVSLRVTYDAPCHLHHAQRIREAPLRLLDAIPGLERIPLAGADDCCGGAGLYGVHHPELGGAILNPKVQAIRETGADVVVTPNPGCMMQIGAGLLLNGIGMAVLHPIEILDESYRRAAAGAGR
jgi:glycolate oxidase iron-sulfur subunit